MFVLFRCYTGMISTPSFRPPYNWFPQSEPPQQCSPDLRSRRRRMLAARPRGTHRPLLLPPPPPPPPPEMAWPRLWFRRRRPPVPEGSPSGRCLKVETAATTKKVEVESAEGGVDMWDAAASPQPEHLVVMVNGLVGSSEDWRFAAEQFVKKLPDKVIVHRSECNCATLTFDGVDMMGERLAEEVISVVNCRQGVKKISFIAHSLGGLIARYAVGRLYEPITSTEPPLSSGNYLDLDHELGGRIAGLEPMNFITSASPHLGSRGNKQLPLLCGLPFLERRASESAHLVVGRTGKHLFLTDNDDGKPPLLLRMVYDCDDIKFMSALRSFKRRVAYANANYDHMVGWRTSSIRRQHELPKYRRLVKDDKYPHIVSVDKENTENILEKALTDVEAQKYDLEEEMIRGLKQVPWERVDVSFQKSRQRFIAHSTIQVKSYWLHSDGADVVFHMIDNFLV